MEGFIEKFHNLGGDTIGEHKKLFNAYVNDLQRADFDANEYLQSLVPTNKQEEIFYISLLRKYNKWNSMLDVMMRGDRILSKIVINKLDYKAAFAQISANCFVNDICPNVSFVSRMNLINKLSYAIDDTKVGRDYFNAVFDKYGRRAAQPFLIACDENFIETTVKEHDPRFNSRHLIYLHKKYPQFLKFYILHKKHTFNPDDTFARYMCQHDLETFYSSLEFNRPILGKKMFSKFLKTYKTDLIKNPNLLIIKSKILYRHLNRDEYMAFFKKLLPDTFHMYNLNLTYIKLMPKKERGRFLFTAFREVYGYDIWTDDDNRSMELLMTIALEDRLKFNLIDGFIELLGTETSIPALKSQINLTSDIQTRSDLIKKLLVTCKANDDIESLLGVIKYVSERHKNDNSHVRQTFLEYLAHNFKLETLSTTHWSYLNDILMLLEVNGEHVYSLAEIYEKYIHHKFLNKLDYLDQLKKYYKIQSLYHIEIFTKHPDYERECLLKYPCLIDQLYNDEKDRAKATIIHLGGIIDFSKRHPDKAISIYDYADSIKVLLKEYEDNTFSYCSRIKDILESKPIGEEQQVIYDEASADIIMSCSRHFSVEIYMWLLKNNPEAILIDAEVIFSSTFQLENFYYEISKMHYSKITKPLNECAIQILGKTDEHCHEKCAAFKFLSFQNNSNFAKLTQRYLPKPACKINVYKFKMHSTLEIQKAIMASYKFFPKPCDGITDILYFCNSDYFRYALESLYFILYHTPEKLIEVQIFELLKRAVSVRKHTIHLSYALGNSELKYRVLRMMAETEKNVSLCKYIFAKIFKAFLADRTDREWKLFSENLNLLSVNDSESLTLIKSFCNIPRQYYPNYVKLIWNFFKSRGKGEEFQLVRHIKIDNSLSNEFYEEVVRTCLFNKKNSHTSDTTHFVSNYLLLGGDYLNARIEIVWKIVKYYVENIDGFRDSIKYVKEIYDLFRYICTQLIYCGSEKQRARHVCAAIKENLGRLKLPCNNFEIYILLDITQFQLLESSSIKSTATYIIEQQKSLIETYGPEIQHIYMEFIVDQLQSILPIGDGDKSDNYLTLVENMLDIDASLPVSLLCLQLLPTQALSKPEQYKHLEKVLDKIRQNKSQVIQVYSDNFLRNAN